MHSDIFELKNFVKIESECAAAQPLEYRAFIFTPKLYACFVRFFSTLLGRCSSGFFCLLFINICF